MKKNRKRVGILLDELTVLRYQRGTPLYVNLLKRAEGEIAVGNIIYINTNQTLLGELKKYFKVIEVFTSKI